MITVSIILGAVALLLLFIGMYLSIPARPIKRHRLGKENEDE